jgi:hypothetical protein
MLSQFHIKACIFSLATFVSPLLEPGFELRVLSFLAALCLPAVFDVASLVCLGSLTRFKVEGYVGYALGPRSPVLDGWFWTFVRKTNVWLLVSSLLPTEPG